MKKMFNEGNQIHYFMSSSGSGSVINYGSGSDFLSSYGSGYGSGSTSQKVTVPTVPVPVPVPQHCHEELLSFCLQKPLALQREHRALQNMNTLLLEYRFLFICRRFFKILRQLSIGSGIYSICTGNKF